MVARKLHRNGSPLRCAGCAEAIALTLLIAAGPAGAIDVYDCEFIDNLAGATNIYVMDINNLGHVIGISSFDGQPSQAWLYDGSMDIIAPLTGTTVDPKALNDWDEVVGQSGSQAFFYNGSTTSLGLGSNSCAWDINNYGYIVGQYDGLPFVRSPGGGVTTLGTLGGIDGGCAASVNEHGLVVGWAFGDGVYVSTGEGGYYQYPQQAFRTTVSGGSLAPLFPTGVGLPGEPPVPTPEPMESESAAECITNSGYIMGWREVDNIPQTFIRGPQLVQMPTGIVDVNDYSLMAYAYSGGWIMHPDYGGTVVLGAVGGLPSNWSVSGVVGINNDGQVLGYAVEQYNNTNKKAFIMTPNTNAALSGPREWSEMTDWSVGASPIFVSPALIDGSEVHGTGLMTAYKLTIGGSAAASLNLTGTAQVQTLTGVTVTDTGTITCAEYGSIDGGLINNGGLVAGPDPSSGNTLWILDSLGGTGGTLTGQIGLPSGAILNPGNSTGTLTFEHLVMSSGSMLQLEINSASDFDRLIVTDSAVFGGSLQLIFGNGYLPANGTPFDLLDVPLSALAGAFPGGITPVGLPQDYDVDFDRDTGRFTSFPEPTTLVLLGLGTAVMLLRRRA